MKPFVARLVALALVVVFGMFAIAQAQRVMSGDTSDADGGAVVTRFASDDGDANDTQTSDAPADPTSRRLFGVDARVHVIRDNQTRPAIYRGKPRAGVVPASAEDETDNEAPSDDASGDGVVVVAGGDASSDATADASAESDKAPATGVPRPLGDAAPNRDYRDAAKSAPQRRYASDIPNAAQAGDKPAANSRAVEPPNAARASDSADSARADDIRAATDAIDAAVAAAAGAGKKNATPAPATTPRRFDTDTGANAGTPARVLPKPRAAVAAPADSVADGPQGTGTPGNRDLEAQTPSLTIEKVVPSEIQVGKTAQFEIRVQNTGRAAARDLQVIDQVPQGTRLVNTEPRADLGERGELIWNLAALDAGSTAVVRVELVPLTEGTVGSVARVRFGADVSARTTVTKPQIALDVAGPENVMIGEQAVLAITVSNPGSGEATGVILEADVPANLKHPAGTELEFEVGTLRPNESRRLELTFTALKQGPASPTLIARAAGVAAVEQVAQLEVVAPKLEIGFEGPKRRFLDRKSPYVVTVSNPGTAVAKDVELIVYLPRGMKFVEANNHGTYDARQHAVYWSLAELPPQRSGDVQLTTVPTESGDHLLRVEGKAQQGLADQVEETISVEGVAALSFQISDLADPLAVGGQASYEVRVVNTGSKSASNVQVVAVLPAEMAPIDATGPTASKLQDKKIVFQPISRLAPKEEKVYRFRAEATAAGDLRVRVQLSSDEIQQPITQEESTRVFADE